MHIERIRELMARLSPQHQQEGLDFALYLAEKECRPERKKLRLDWAGGLAEFKHCFRITVVSITRYPGRINGVTVVSDLRHHCHCNHSFDFFDGPSYISRMATFSPL